MDFWRKPIRLVATLSLLAATFVAATAQTGDSAAMDEAEKARILGKLEAVLTRQAFVPNVDFTKWPEMVKSKEKAIQESKTRIDFAMAVNKILADYGFSHISLFPPSFGDQRTNLKRAGIGIRVAIEEKGLRVTDVFPDSPASEVGLKEGDLVVQCDGKPVHTAADLAGEKGQASDIVVERGTEQVKVHVTRRDYKTVIPESLTWQGDVAIVKVPTFDVGYSKQNLESIFEVVVPKAKGVILDLRGNGGGRVTNLQHLASFFFNGEDLPMGTFVGKPQMLAYESANGKTSDLKAVADYTKFKTRANIRSDGLVVNVPISVLVDGGSASASEIMAAALHEVKGAPVVGSKSAGAVLASLILPLDEEAGFWVQYPVTDYLTIKGLRLEGNGVSPDFLAKQRVWGQPDEAVAIAMKAMKLVPALAF